jgi:hypothetical protein
MKKILLLIFLMAIGFGVYAQSGDGPKGGPGGGPCGRSDGGGYSNENAHLISSMKNFHDQLVDKEIWCIQKSVHDSLTYGHSNGWVENKADLTKNILNEYITYHSFKEDSIHVMRDGNTAYIRFIADIDATLNNKRSTFHLKVLEIWVKKNDEWVLFARQAVRG